MVTSRIKPEAKAKIDLYLSKIHDKQRSVDKRILNSDIKRSERGMQTQINN